MSVPIFRGVAAALAVLSCAGCDAPDAESSSGAGSLDTEAFAAELESLDRDLARLAAVGEALEAEPEKLAERFLEQGEFVPLLERHEAEIGRLIRGIAAMDEDAREPFRERLQSSLRSLEGRMEAALATGPAAEDAFGPMLAEIQERLRSGL